MIAATDAKKVTKRNDLTINLIIKEILLVDALFFSSLDFFSLFVFSDDTGEPESALVATCFFERLILSDLLSFFFN
jgi:hypothetical protein